jgi:hypothetical protein
LTMIRRIHMISMIKVRHIVLVVGVLWTTNLVGQGNNTLSKQEKKDGWMLLFDGNSTKGWRNYNKPDIGAGWKAVDGILCLDPKAGKGGDILFEKEFENFELILEWKVDSCGNSGIFFNAAEAEKYKWGYYTGPEMQILDNDCHPDAKIAKHRAGNLYDLIASPTESVKKYGELNSVKIISNQGHLEMWLNEVKQVDTNMYTPEWAEMIKGSKFKNHPDFGTYRKGHIMLQDHGDRAWFRNIKIREL